MPDPVLPITALDLARRFLGVKEVPGPESNPHLLAMLKLDTSWPSDDVTPHCSAFVNYIAWLLELPRTRTLLARHWLTVGRGIPVKKARPGFDVIVFSRGNNPRHGHVGFFASHGRDHHPQLLDRVMCLGANQKNAVSVASYPVDRVLGVRRLYV